MRIEPKRSYPPAPPAGYGKPKVVEPVRTLVPAGVVDACASRISDPVSRLTFLRRAVHLPGKKAQKKPMRYPAWLAPALSVVLVFLAVRPTSEPVPPETPVRERPVVLQAAPPAADPSVTPRVWLVEKKGSSELYSNGLRIENAVAGPERPRQYKAFERGTPDGSRWRLRTDPAGIVFHTSEGDLVEFKPELNGALRRQAQGLVAYTQRRQCYHFVIDRFGQVHRIVSESSKADHAGHSIWADNDWIYIGLNNSFLGVAFEAQSREGEGVSPAQVHAARVLTEMLRSRYGISAGNCVTHAQVSVNPGNFGIGYHTDWAGGFPFAELGLSNNYELPLPSLLFYGFDADSSYVALAGGELRNTVAKAEEQIRQAAEAQGVPVERYRAELRRQYARAASAAGGPTER